MTQSLLPVELHHRLIEQTAAFAAFNALRTLRDAVDSQFEMMDVAGATVLIDPARPDSEYYNRVLGLSDGALGRLDEVFAPLLHVGAPLRIDVADRATSPALCAALHDRGLRPYEALTYLARRPAPLQLRPRNMQVRRLGPRGADAFLDLLEGVRGYIDPEIREKRRGHYATDTFRVWLATVDDEPAGWATMFVHGKTGVFANAYTLERYRRRGCQTALFAARLADADALKLDWVATDVRPGSTSHRNAERAGFRSAGVHTVWRAG